jgi:hypothetical protein
MNTALMLAEGLRPDVTVETAQWVWWALGALVLAFFAMVGIAAVASVKLHRRQQPGPPGLD